jgi:hypothetical protein
MLPKRVAVDPEQRGSFLNGVPAAGRYFRYGGNYHFSKKMLILSSFCLHKSKAKPLPTFLTRRLKLGSSYALLYFIYAIKSQLDGESKFNTKISKMRIYISKMRMSLC